MDELDFKMIGEKIKHVRNERNFTQDYVAEKVGVNVSHISNIENNRVKVSLTALVAICKVLNTTVDYILSSEYAPKEASGSLDNEILKAMQDCSNETKEKILQIIKIL